MQVGLGGGRPSDGYKPPRYSGPGSGGRRGAGAGGQCDGGIVVNVTVNGPALGTTGQQIAENIAEPLRAVYARRGRNNVGDYVRSG